MTIIADDRGSGILASGADGKQEHLRNMRWQQAAFNIFFSMFGASQVPWAISQMGWVWGSIVFFLLCLCAWWSGHILTDCCIRSGCYTWFDLCTKAFGHFGGWLVAVIQTSGIIITGMVQTQGMGSLWGQSFPEAGLCSWWWILVNAAPYLIFLQIPSFGGNWLMVFATAITLVSVVWQQVLYTVLIFDKGPYPHTCWDGQNFTSIVAGTCNLVFSFAVKNILPEMMRELKEPREMHKAWAWSQGIALPLYMFFGFIGFSYYGIFTQNAGFSLQYSASPAIVIYTIFSLVGQILPCVYGQLCVFLKVELRLGVLPTDWWTVSNPAENRFSKVPPVLFRFLFRMGCVAIYIFVAESLLDVGLGFFSSFAGALSMTAFSFYLPWLVHWKLHGNTMSFGMKLVCLTWGILGIAVAIAGVVTSIQSMSQMSGGIFVFKESECSQNAFYIGEYSGSGINNPYDNGAFSSNTSAGSFYREYYLPVCEGTMSSSQKMTCSQLESPTPNPKCAGI